jgi:hypothetical protein
LARKIIQSYYTIDAANDTIKFPDYVMKEEIYLVVDVDTGTELVNFVDPELAVNTWSWSEADEELTITTVADLSALGVTDSSNIQIIVDRPLNEIEVADSLLDPVHKIRVSTPENLIDTDFEYGLQPTKWETLELSNNVPSFYVADGDSALQIVTGITTKAGSDIVTVTCSDEHGLVIGTPIDAQGLTSRTAEGKFLIKSADTTTFTYQANAVQPNTGSIGSIYSTITPGRFYAGSQITYDKDTGVETDGQPQSTLSITTPNPHGFVDNSNFYLVNTVATKTLKVTETTTSNAPDGRPYVDFDDEITVTPTVDLTKTETKAWRPPHSIKFDATAVNLAADSINWPNHRMRNNDTVLYVPPSGDTQIGGLDRFDFYYVKVLDDDNIQLTTSRDGSAINFTNTGSYNYGRAMIGMVYEIWRGRGNYRDSYGYAYPVSYYNNGVGSGWDMNQFDEAAGGYGLSGGADEAWRTIDKVMLCSRTNQRIEDYLKDAYTYGPQQDSTNYVFPETGTKPNRWNFIEDDAHWIDSTWFFNRDYAGRPFRTANGGYWRFRKQYNYNGGYRYFGAYSGTRDVFVVPLIRDDEADTFYSQNLELADNDDIDLTITSGDLEVITGASTNRNLILESTVSAGTYQIEKVGNDRFRLQSGGTTQRIREATGVYGWAGTTANNVKNSFYLAEHALNQDSNITIDATQGSLPSATTGALNPVNPDTVTYEFSLIKDGITDFFTANTGRVDIVTSATPQSGYITNGVRSGSTKSYQYVSTSQITTRFWSPVDQSTQQVTYLPTDISEDEVYYPYDGNRHEAYLPTLVGSDFQANSTIPFWASLRKFNEVNGATYARYEQYLYLYHRSVGGRTYTGSELNTRSYSAANNNYYWSASWQKNYGNSTGQDVDTILISYKIRNRSLFDSNAWMVSYRYQNGDQLYVYNYNNSYEEDLQGLICLQVEETFFWDNTILEDFMETIIDSYDTGMIYPTLTNQTTYKVNVLTNDRIQLKSDTGLIIDLASAGGNDLAFTTDAEIGIVDGAYSASNVTSTGWDFTTNFQVDPVIYNFNGANIGSDQEFAITNGHKLQNGAALVYDNNSNTTIGGLIDGSTYYAIVVDDVYIQLASSFDNALNGVAITLTGQTGTHKLESQSISGVSEAVGIVDTTETSDILTGDGTLFKRYFKVGDKIYIKDNNLTPGSLAEFTVVAIADDASLQVDRPVGFAATDTKHFVETNIYARPDGYSLHRPFDGGVEIAAGTAPYSSIRRQTRKYFRYQSGKGIQTSVAINFNPPVTVESLTSSGTTATITTEYPHRLSTGMEVTVKNASEGLYNGTFSITKVDEFTFTYTLTGTPTTSIPNGIIKYNVVSYSDAATRVGMFDMQNGFFFEYDGVALSCVRRTSTTQISGTAQVTKNSNLIQGTGTNFIGQVNEGDFIVLRGQSYKVVQIDDATTMYVQPEYRGISASNVVITKTEDIKVEQSEWNLDKCDGTGAEGFVLDINKIQMAYMDYSWYGAGKIRFGFKDRKGHVRYVHEFLHNNRLDEAYMRSGNMAAAYEVINGANPTYAPTLFHWGTSVIMDGTFDEDEAYLFTATSNNLSFTNGQSISATTTGTSALIRFYNRNQRNYDFYVRIPFAESDATKLTSGSPLYTTGGELTGQTISFTQYSGSTIYAYIYISSGSYYNTPAVYPVVASGIPVTIGEDPGGTDETVNLGTDIIPLVSLRLAPSVDNAISGFLGERDIINRMQLKLNEVGLILTHDSEIKLILNGDLSKVAWENVNSPSLSQLQKHNAAEKITGGTEVFSFRAAGGGTDSTGARLSNSTNFSLEQLIDMGNSILGGDGVFPNGPDILTVAVQVVDTADISASSPFKISGRITWSESQA